MPNVSVLGLGAMGSRMAMHLVSAGHRVVVYNRTRVATEPLVARGALSADTPRAAVRDAQVVISMVRDDEASRAVWLDDHTGALGGLADGAVVVECSTLTPAWVRHLSDCVSARGHQLVDAPVVGTRPQAEAAGLLILAGGEQAAVERAEPVLSCLGRVRHVGPTGSGATLKLAVNTLFASQVAVLAEMAGLLARSGVNWSDAMRTLADLPVTSPAASGVARLMAERRVEPLFPVQLVEKDLRYAAASVIALGGEAPLTEATADRYRVAMARGLADLNIAAIARLSDPTPSVP